METDALGAVDEIHAWENLIEASNNNRQILNNFLRVWMRIVMLSFSHPAIVTDAYTKPLKKKSQDNKLSYCVVQDSYDVTKTSHEQHLLSFTSLVLLDDKSHCNAWRAAG